MIVGEVKSDYKTKKEILNINEDKFENPFIKQKIKELIGSTTFKKCLYCWSWTPETRVFAKNLGIKPVSLSEIIDHLLRVVEGHKGWLYLKDYPNLMLLQFLKAENYLKAPKTS